MSSKRALSILRSWEELADFLRAFQIEERDVAGKWMLDAGCGSAARPYSWALERQRRSLGWWTRFGWSQGLTGT